MIVIAKEKQQEKQRTAEELIEKRKSMWEDGKGIENDRKYVNAVVDHLVDNKELQLSVQANPDFLIQVLAF